MNGELPVRPGEVGNWAGWESLPAFLDFDSFKGAGRAVANRSHLTEHDDDILTISGTCCPWFARQRFGKYAGVIVKYRWSTNRSSAVGVMEDLGYEVVSVGFIVHDTEVSREDTEETLFAEVEPRQSILPPNYAEMQRPNDE